MTNRISSIDIFRALTMFLMIFVNDLWSLHDIPGWLEHTKTHEDGMGLADTVFPAFLFIVGLSIPFAIKARINKGHNKFKIMVHILLRSLALVIMGFFMVNLEMYRQDIPEFIKNIWQICMIIAFILIWNTYENDKIFQRIPVWLLKGVGVIILIVLALAYKGGTPENPEWMQPHWWGILGLIGWAYLVCATIYLLAGNKLWIIIVSWLILHALNAQEFIPLIEGIPRFRIIVGASNHALVMSGIVATIFYMQLKNDNKIRLFTGVLILLATISIAYGFITRPLWGISKNMATPSWTTICAGISFVAFAVLYIISDLYKFTRWANPIMPAGRSTLTCYMLPYLVYPIFYPLLKHLPDSFTGGLAGIIKSLIFAMLIVILTGLFEKMKIKLKI